MYVVGSVIINIGPRHTFDHNTSRATLFMVNCICLEGDNNHGYSIVPELLELVSGLAEPDQPLEHSGQSP